MRRSSNKLANTKNRNFRLQNPKPCVWVFTALSNGRKTKRYDSLRILAISSGGILGGFENRNNRVPIKPPYNEIAEYPTVIF